MHNKYLMIPATERLTERVKKVFGDDIVKNVSVMCTLHKDCNIEKFVRELVKERRYLCRQPDAFSDGNEKPIENSFMLNDNSICIEFCNGKQVEVTTSEWCYISNVTDIGKVIINPGSDA